MVVVVAIAVVGGFFFGEKKENKSPRDTESIESIHTFQKLAVNGCLLFVGM